MLFNSYQFLFVFLPLTLAGAALARKFGRTPLVWVLIGASLIFYAAWSPRYLPLLVLSIAFNYLMGLAVIANRSRPRGRIILALGIAADLSLLAYFKYATFALSNLDLLTGLHLRPHDIELPVGISFFTFTQIAFLVDAYRSEISTYKPGQYALFVSYFPHLVAGPILHHNATIPQFETSRFARFDAEDVTAGVFLFSVGLAKKMILADRFGYYSDIIFRAAHNGVHLTIWEAWGGALAYAFQIYFDFSGYSDMAVGLSRIIGVRIPINFNSPYKAESIVEFWRHWHMSLSAFLRDYLYIPLGGNRKGPFRRYANLMITMVLGGLWHGAGWGFVIWGFAHGVFLSVNHLWRNVLSARGRSSARTASALGRWSGRVLTFASVVVAWSFFRAVNIAAGWGIVSAMFGANGLTAPQSLGHLLGRYSGVASAVGIRFEGLFANGLVEDSIPKMMALLATGIVICWFTPNSIEWCASLTRNSFELSPDQEGRVSFNRFKGPSPRLTAIAAGILLAFGILSLQHESPFIYYQF